MPRSVNGMTGPRAQWHVEKEHLWEHASVWWTHVLKKICFKQKTVGNVFVQVYHKALMLQHYATDSNPSIITCVHSNLCTYYYVILGDVETESLEEHNKLRAKHFSPPLAWSASLARKAQTIADNMAAKDFLTLDDLQEPQGESLAQILYTGESTARKAIKKWYNEIQSYSFSYPKINDKTRHFVQIIWKGTKEMGLAVAKSTSGEYAFVVALYNPPISSEGHLRQNILRPGLKHDLYSTIRKRKRLAEVI